MIGALVLAALVAPTPSPTLSPLPTAVVNYYAAKGAEASGLDTSLVRAVIDNESAGDPHAVSKAGAVGLMQLEADTANDCGISDRFDALSNAICGSKTLRYLITAYGMKNGIAAYNFGAGNVASGKSWPDETKNYVASVIARYDALQHESLAVSSPSPSPSPVTFTVHDGSTTGTYQADVAAPSASVVPPITADTPLFDRIFGRRQAESCANVAPVMGAAQVTDSIVAANAIRRGSVGVRIFGSASPLGFIAETLIFDALVHRVERHAPCAVKVGTDLLLTGAAVHNATTTEFPR